jgi:hypothetical protein
MMLKGLLSQFANTQKCLHNESQMGKKQFLLFFMLLCPFLASAQLSVTILEPRVSESAAIIPLTMQNRFGQKISSVKATVFLMNDHGGILGHSTKWLITNHDKIALAPGCTNSFNFVVPLQKSRTNSNLFVKVTINRAVFESGEPVDVIREVNMQYKGN